MPTHAKIIDYRKNNREALALFAKHFDPALLSLANRDGELIYRSRKCRLCLRISGLNFSQNEGFYIEVTKPAEDTSYRSPLFDDAGGLDQVLRSLKVTLQGCENNTNYEICEIHNIPKPALIQKSLVDEDTMRGKIVEWLEEAVGLDFIAEIGHQSLSAKFPIRKPLTTIRRILRNLARS